MAQQLSSSVSALGSDNLIIGERVKLLVDAISDLREIGVDHLVTLPELILCGDQSAGKSTLMGALTEIHLPRDAGTCTRCPTHIKTSPAAIWSGSISLHQLYSYDTTKGQIKPTSLNGKNPFPPWKEQSQVVRPFMTIHHKSELEDALRWAQRATLNDSKDYRSYIPGTPGFKNDTTIQANFSPNVVSIEISGPGLPALSFYDLPGTISTTATKETEYLVQMVENLVVKYIQHPQAIIICALPMSADAALSRTLKLIRDKNAEERCIGVLTKPDMLPAGDTDENSQFAKILNGTDHRLGHGYFVTKQPKHNDTFNTDNHSYHKQAQVIEEGYFDTQEPWASEWQTFRSRCGTKRLQQELSQKFGLAIARSIPSIEKKIKERATQIKAALDALPELPKENVLPAVFNELIKFSNGVKGILRGGAESNGFQSEFNELCSQFCSTILEMRPGIKVSHPLDSVPTEVIDLDTEAEEENDDDQSAFDKRSAKRVRVELSTPNNTRGGGPEYRDSPIAFPGLSATDATKSECTPRRLAQIQRAPTTPKETHFSKYAQLGKGFTSIEEIGHLIHENTKTGMPAMYDTAVQMKLCRQSVTPWKEMLTDLLDKTMESFRKHLEVIFMRVLSKWQQTQLFRESTRLLLEFLEHFAKEQLAANEALYHLEVAGPFTMNVVAFEHYGREEEAALRKGRKHYRWRAFEKRESLTRRKSLSETERKNAEQRLKEMPDQFEQELKVAIYLRTYYKTAALRFADSVCLSMNGNLLHGIRDQIDGFLERELRLAEGGNVLNLEDATCLLTYT